MDNQKDAASKYLEEYYNSYDEEGRLSDRHGSVEFLTTTRYIDKYLRPGDRILEVGAATGRYSLHYARKGYQVDSIELILHNIEQFKKNMTKDMNVTIHQGNACNLSGYEDNIFDITLILGPLYHLYTVEDKLKAIEEACRVTKPGGIIYLAFIMNDAVILDWGLKSGNLAMGLNTGMVTKDFHCVGTPEMLFEMTTVEDINNLVEKFPLEKLHMVASDGMTNHFRNEIENADKELFEAWLSYHFHTCERADLIGFSNHGLFIGRKNSNSIIKKY